MKNSNTTKETITTRLREAKTLSGLSYAQLSRLSGIPARTIEEIIAKGHMPRADTLAAICRALGCSGDWVLGVDEVDALKWAVGRIERMIRG